MQTHDKLSVFCEQNVIEAESLVDTCSFLRVSWVQVTARLPRVHEISQNRTRLRQDEIAVDQGRNLVRWVQLQELLRVLLSLREIHHSNVNIDSQVLGNHHSGSGRRRSRRYVQNRLRHDSSKASNSLKFYF